MHPKSRDQRVQNNWALLYAQQQARSLQVPLIVAFSLTAGFPSASSRHYGFMLRGLRQMQSTLQQTYGIPFQLLRGNPASTIPALAHRLNSSFLCTDFSPLRGSKQWRESVARVAPCPMAAVDGHNVVPCFQLERREHAARTIRPKLWRMAPEFLTGDPFPDLQVQRNQSVESEMTKEIDVEELLRWVRESGSPQNEEGDDDDKEDDEEKEKKDVPEVDWIQPGEAAAQLAANRFLTKERLKLYEKRNDITEREALSDMSPYLHFGQISAQQLITDALDLKRREPSTKEGVDSFVEELWIRRELSDNFCNYEENYDNMGGAAEWAKETLQHHSKDKRQYVYTEQQFDRGETHDQLWNAAQRELVHKGKLHGYIRMYWAKKILEWCRTPEEALRISIALNDKYSLDGRDPNGYVGCMWSICGTHDRGWTERKIFGKIRFMNYNGFVRKFKQKGIDKYIEYTKSLVTGEPRQTSLSWAKGKK